MSLSPIGPRDRRNCDLASRLCSNYCDRRDSSGHEVIEWGRHEDRSRLVAPGRLAGTRAVGSAVVRGRVDQTQHVDRRHRACEPLAERPRQVHAILAPRSDLGDLRHRGHPGPRSDRGRARMARHGSLRHRGQGRRRHRAGRWPALGAAHGDGEVAHRRSVSGQGPRRDPPGGRFGTARAWRGASTSRSSSRRRPARSPPARATRSSTAAS